MSSITNRFLLTVKRPIGLEIYISDMMNGIGLARSSAINDVTSVQEAVRKVFDEERRADSDRSWNRHVYIIKVVETFLLKVKELEKESSQTVCAALAELSIFAVSLISLLEKRKTALYQNIAMTDWMATIPVIPGVEYDTLLEVYDFIHQTEKEIGSEYCAQNSYVHSDVVILDDKRWIELSSEGQIHLFLEWKTNEVLVLVGEGQCNYLNWLKREYPEKISVASLDEVVEIGLKVVQGFLHFMKRKRFDRDVGVVKVVVLNRFLGHEPVQILVPGNAQDGLKKIQAWIGGLAYLDSAHTTTPGSLVGNLFVKDSNVEGQGTGHEEDASQKLVELQGLLGEWESLEIEQQRLAKRDFLRRMGTQVMSNILLIQDRFKFNHSSVSSQQQPSLSNWLASYVSLGIFYPPIKTSEVDLRRKNYLIEANDKFVFSLRILMDIPNEVDRAAAIIQLIFIHEQVLEVLSKGEENRNYREIQERYEDLSVTIPQLVGWRTERMPSFVGVAFEYFREQEKEPNRKVSPLFPIVTRGKRRFLIIAEWIGRPDITVGYKWKSRKFRCIKAREGGFGKIEQKIFSLLDCGLGKVKIIDSLGNPQSSDKEYQSSELVLGSNLEDYIRGTEISEKEKTRIFLELARCVKKAHDLGYVFQDMKISQFVIKGDGTIVLVDGESIINEDSRIVYDGQEVKPVKTTLILVAPEVVRVPPGCSLSFSEFIRQLNMTMANDIWMLGCAAYHIFMRKSLPHEKYYTCFEPSLVGLDSYSKRLDQFTQEGQHWVPLSESSYVIFSDHFGIFVNGLVRDMMQFEPSKRPTAGEVVERAEAYMSQM